MPKISIIVPVYNAEKTISRAVQSVFAQTFTDYELIIVDDGSTDGSNRLIQNLIAAFRGSDFSFKNINIQHINQENQGPAGARNTGIQLARGEYVAFLDADDQWDKEKLEIQMNAFKQHPQAGLVFSDMRHFVIERVGKETLNKDQLVHASYLHERRYQHAASGMIYENLLHENFIFTPTVLVRKSVLDHVGSFDAQLKICEDYDLWLRIAQEYPIYFIDQPLVSRYQTGSNLTANGYVYTQSSIALRKKLLELNSHLPYRVVLLKHKLAKDQFALGYILFNQGNLKSAREVFGQLILKPDYFFSSLFYMGATLLPRPCVAVLRKLKHAGVHLWI